MQNNLIHKEGKIKANALKLANFSFPFLVFIFLISFSSASMQVGIDGSLNEIGINFDRTPFNISTQTVNHSNSANFLLTNIGSIGNFNSTQFFSDSNVLNIDESYLESFGDTLYCELTGCNITGNLYLLDTAGEEHMMSRELEILDDARISTTISRLNLSITGDTLNIVERIGLNIAVNLHGNTEILPFNSDSIVLTEGTNTTPIYNHVFYENGATTSLEKSMTHTDDRADVAEILMGSGKDYASLMFTANQYQFARKNYYDSWYRSEVYKDGFNITVTGNEINISTGLMWLFMRDEETLNNLSSTISSIEIDNGGDFVQHTGNLDGYNEYGTGETITNNKYFNMICGVANTLDQMANLYCMTQDMPDSEHNKEIDAELDMQFLNHYPSHQLVKKVYTPLVRVVMKRTGGVNNIQSLSAYSGDFIDLRGRGIGTSGSPPVPGLTSLSQLNIDSNLEMSSYNLSINFINGVSTGTGFTYMDIWAEENGATSTGLYEWSYGNGDEAPSGGGIIIPQDSELYAIGTTTAASDSSLRVNVNIGGVVQATSDTHSGLSTLTTLGSPVSFSAGDVMDFQTNTAGSQSAGARVTAYFRIPFAGLKGDDGDDGVLQLVLDTTPQLGGNLDDNGFNITGTGHRITTTTSNDESHYILNSAQVSSNTSETFPGTADSGNIVSGGFGPWTNENNIKADDGSEAQVSFGIIPTESDSLEATNFSFNIPSDATITGIVLKIERRPDTSNTISDNTMKLTKNGTAGVGDNKANPGFWSVVEVTITYGGTTDLWGTTWTPAEINADTFGAYLTADSTASFINGFVDYMSIQVYYTLGENKTYSTGAYHDDGSYRVTSSDSLNSNIEYVLTPEGVHLFGGITTSFGFNSSVAEFQGNVTINGSVFTFSPTDENYTAMTRGNELPSPNEVLREDGHLDLDKMFDKEWVTDTSYPFQKEDCPPEWNGICFNVTDFDRPVYVNKTDPFQIGFNNRLILTELLENFKVEEYLTTSNKPLLVEEIHTNTTKDTSTMTKISNFRNILKTKTFQQVQNFVLTPEGKLSDNIIFDTEQSEFGSYKLGAVSHFNRAMIVFLMWENVKQQEEIDELTARTEELCAIKPDLSWC